MSQSGFTPIQLYRTSTAAAVPTAGNLAAGELAINLTDEALYFKNTAGVVTLLADSSGALGSVTSVAASGGTTGLTFSGSPITTSGTLTLGGTLGVANGGTGVTTSTGTGSVVLSNTPTLVTPVLGAASATSITTALGSVSAPSYTFTGDTNTGIYSPAADTIAFTGGGVEAMRIDGSGNVGIGNSTAAPKFSVTLGTGFAWGLGWNTAVAVFGGNGAASGAGSGGLGIAYDDASGGTIGPVVPGVAWKQLRLFSDKLVFYTNGASERMRIDTDGNLLWGKTSLGSEVTTDGAILYKNASGGGSTAYFTNGGNGTVLAVSTQGDTGAVVFYRSNTLVGSISVTSSSTAYNTSSDYRLKEIDGPIANSGAYIDALKPVQGSWKADGSRFIGLLAHEVQDVSETTIATGEKDGEKMQAMDYSAPELIANLIAEVQSLRARVAQLEGN